MSIDATTRGRTFLDGLGRVAIGGFGRSGKEICWAAAGAARPPVTSRIEASKIMPLRARRRHAETGRVLVVNPAITRPLGKAMQPDPSARQQTPEAKPPQWDGSAPRSPNPRSL